MIRPIRTLAALVAAVALAACAGQKLGDGTSKSPPPVALKAKVEAAGQATANLTVEVFGFPATHLAAHAEGGGTLDIDSSRTPPVVLTGTWTVEQDVPPGAPNPLGDGKPGASAFDSPCEPKPAAPAPVCDPPAPAAPAPRLCEPPVPAAPAPAPCAPKVGAAPPAKASAGFLGGIFGCDESRRGRPVYVGCSGTPGGNKPTPRGDLAPAIEPGTGWPCSSKAGKVGAAVGCPTGFAAIFQGISDVLSGHVFGP